MSDEELEVLIDECEDDGVLEDTKSEITKSAIRFDDIEVDELYVLRMDVTAVFKDVSAAKLSNPS